MLMSLTMRMRPTPPADSWGVISVVAIQHLPSLAGGIVLPVIYGLQRRKHPIISANEQPRPVKSPACSPDEPILKRGGSSYGLAIESCRTGPCCGTYYIVTRAIQRAGFSLTPRNVSE